MAIDQSIIRHSTLPQPASSVEKVFTSTTILQKKTFLYQLFSHISQSILHKNLKLSNNLAQVEDTSNFSKLKNVLLKHLGNENWANGALFFGAIWGQFKTNSSVKPQLRKSLTHSFNCESIPPHHKTFQILNPGFNPHLYYALSDKSKVAFIVKLLWTCDQKKYKI